MSHERLEALAIGVLFFALALAFVGLSRPPAPVPASAPASEFSAERAMVHVAEIARRPHPVGSEAQARVRDYLVLVLEGLGLETHVERATGMTAKYRASGPVENVVGRLRGSPSARAERPALMLAAHYDSVPAGPGAGDDASGVAAILEAVRALRTGPPLQNDLIVLFTDGEEAGLLGASAFMAEDPWARDVHVVANFEARGNTGVSSLFETSEGNGVLVSEAARGIPSLVGSSLSYEVYKRMPNDTDVTVFKAYGIAALNFAFVGHWAAYHTADDDAQHLDRGSLQQQGDYALGLARTLGDDDLHALAGPDAVFFAVPGVFVHYSPRCGLALAVAATLLVAFAVWRYARDGRAPLGQVAAGLGLFCLVLVVTAGSGMAVAGLGRSVSAEAPRAGPSGAAFGSSPHAWAIVGVALAVWALMQALGRTRLSADAVALGAAVGLAGLALDTSFALPGAAYVFVWPALGAGAQLAIPTKVSRALRSGLAVLFALPALAIVAPLVHAVFEALGVTLAGGASMGLLVTILSAAIAHPLSPVLATRAR